MRAAFSGRRHGPRRLLADRRSVEDRRSGRDRRHHSDRRTSGERRRSLVNVEARRSSQAGVLFELRLVARRSSLERRHIPERRRGAA